MATNSTSVSTDSDILFKFFLFFFLRLVLVWLRRKVALRLRVMVVVHPVYLSWACCPLPLAHLHPALFWTQHTWMMETIQNAATERKDGLSLPHGLGTAAKQDNLKWPAGWWKNSSVGRSYANMTIWVWFLDLTVEGENRFLKVIHKSPHVPCVLGHVHSHTHTK